MATLRRIYGEEIPEPEAWLITRWAHDPFAYGSYSYTPVGASSEDYEALAEPVEDRLFFAGEATYRERPATVHGAYLSGIREAKRIAEL
jgi:monoamine oxidase